MVDLSEIISGSPANGEGESQGCIGKISKDSQKGWLEITQVGFICQLDHSKQDISLEGIGFAPLMRSYGEDISKKFTPGMWANLPIKSQNSFMLVEDELGSCQHEG